MPKFKIEHDVDCCIGCGSCAAVCPENWEMIEGGGKSRPKKTEINKIGCNQEAADTCPAHCIKIIKL